MRRYLLARALFPLLLAGASGHAFAQTADPAAGTAQPQPEPSDPSATAQPAATEGTQAAQAEQAADDKKWKFYTLGYVWLAHAKGKTDVIGPVAPVDLDLSLGDLLDGFKFIFMGAAEAQHDRFVILGDLSFVHLGVDEGIGIRDPDFLNAELDSRTAEITLLGGYRVVNDGPVTLDLLAGGRMNWFSTGLQLEGPNRSIEGKVKQNWLDPLIGARTHASLGGKWGLSVYGDVGGILWGSDITYQGVATVDYQINQKMSVGVGYRHWKVDYDDGDFLYDVKQSGPLIVLRSRL